MEGIIIFLLFGIMWVLLPAIPAIIKQKKDKENKKLPPIPKKGQSRSFEKKPIIINKNQEIVDNFGKNLSQKHNNVLEKPSIKLRTLVQNEEIHQKVEENKENFNNKLKNKNTDKQSVVPLDLESIRKGIIFSEILRSQYIDYNKN